jgi:hypothetical protein
MIWVIVAIIGASLLLGVAIGYINGFIAGVNYKYARMPKEPFHSPLPVLPEIYNYIRRGLNQVGIMSWQREDKLSLEYKGISYDLQAIPINNKNGQDS